MDQLTTVGIDLAKDVFAICVLDATGAVLQRRVLRREAFMRWAEQLSPCRVAMEACGSSHHALPQWPLSGKQIAGGTASTRPRAAGRGLHPI